MSIKNKPSLVGIVPRPKLWQLLQTEKWYHIPMASAPDITPNVEYVAFYFPECFENKLRYKIQYYAKVIKVDIAKRVKLFPNELQHQKADKKYYQLHLKEIQTLPHLITVPKWRRIIHIQTNKQKLFTAQDVNDLYDTSPIEDLMYQALKQQKILAERQYYERIDDNHKYYLDFGIFCRNGQIDIECDGEQYHTLPEDIAGDRQRNNQLASRNWLILRFTGHEIKRNLKNCLEIINKTIHQLGGLKLC